MIIASTNTTIKFQTVGRYRGTEIYMTKQDGKEIFVVWMDKFYSADKVSKLTDLVDEWWKLRRN